MEERKNIVKQLLQKKKAISFLLASLLAFFTIFICLAKTASASESHNVLDNTNTLDSETIEYIDRLNNTELSKIKGHPQLAVVVKNELPNNYGLDEYGQYLFDKYKFGTKDYDNGVLFLIVMHPHHFRMQTGYGAESVLPDAYVNELMNDRVQRLFRANNYNEGVRIMAKKAVDRMLKKQDNFRSPSAVNAHQGQVLLEQKREKQEEQRELANLAKATKMMAIIIGIGLIVCLIIAILSSAITKKREEQEAKLQAQRLEEYKAKLMQYKNGFAPNYTQDIIDSVTRYEKLEIMSQVDDHGEDFAVELNKHLAKIKKKKEEEKREKKLLEKYDQFLNDNKYDLSTKDREVLDEVSRDDKLRLAKQAATSAVFLAILLPLLASIRKNDEKREEEERRLREEERRHQDDDNDSDNFFGGGFYDGGDDFDGSSDDGFSGGFDDFGGGGGFSGGGGGDASW